MTCVEESALQRYLIGLLPPADAAAVDAHLKGCADCRARLEQLRASSATQEVSLTPRTPMLPTAGSAETQETGSKGSNPTRRRSKHPPLPRGTALGRYMVLDPLGEGGMGVVYAAYDPELDRKVAVKLLQPQLAGRGGLTGQARLLREAQVLARLSHPNIIAVYDVGTFAERVFVALEFVDGLDLRDWLKQRPRSWREAMDVMLAAGRGLAAAHDAGLVHRDVKPDNILVSKDGRVRVTDFGLARMAQSVEPEEHPLGAEPPEPSSGVLQAPLTQAGIVLGTPEYMAPEQFHHGTANVHTDQFSFCVTLYEALYREFPFDPKLRQQPAEQWKVRDPPRDTRVPAWVRRVLLRGLSPSPTARYPSMHRLLQALGQDPTLSRRRVAAAVGALALALVAFGGYRLVEARQSQLCKGAETKLAGVWDEPRRKAVHDAFVATGDKGAEDAWKGTRRLVDDFARAWVDMRSDACVATRLRGEQSEEVLALRMSCLDGRLRELDALTDLFTKADAKLVDRAVEAATNLSSLKACADLEALRAPVKPPDEAIRPKVEALRVGLAQAKALMDAGRYKQGLERANELVASSRELRYLPVQAEALNILGRLQVKAGDSKGAEETLYSAEWAAEASKLDAVAAEASTWLVYVHYLLGRYDQGYRWGQHADAVLQRMGGDERIESELLNFVGGIYRSEGKFAEALSRYERSVAMREKSLGPEHPDVGRAFFNVGLAYREKGEFEKALPAAERSVVILEKSLGANHMSTLNFLAAQAAILTDMGQPQRALPLLERAFEARRPRLGPEHPFLGLNYLDLGDAKRKLGDTAAALADYEKAVAILTKGHGPEHPRVATAFRQQGLALKELGRSDEALANERRAVAIIEKALSPESFELVDPLRYSGDILVEQGKHREALAAYERALAVAEKAFGKDGQRLSYVLTGMGRAHLALGEPAKALPLLERALKVREGHTVDPADDAETRFALAKALRLSRADAERAQRLAEQARTAWSQAGKAKSKQVALTNAFLGAQGAP